MAVDEAYRSRLLAAAAVYINIDHSKGVVSGDINISLVEYIRTWDSRHTDAEVRRFIVERGGREAMLNFWRTFPEYFDADQAAELIA